MFENGKEMFKEWHYKYGLMACGNLNEIEAALKTIAEYDLKEVPENSFRYRLIYRAMFKGTIWEHCTIKLYVFKAKNRTQMFAACDRFIELTNGLIMKQNVNRPVSA